MKKVIDKVFRSVYNSSIARKVYRTSVGRFIFHLPETIKTVLDGAKDDVICPPKWREYTGRGDYTEVGLEFFRYFRELCDISSNDNVLDVGSGIGRMAVPLAKFLSSGGKYIGIEVVPSGVKWCQKNISTKYPRVSFVHADIKNRLYNPKGVLEPDTYSFPIPKSSIDFCFLTSVFTHMSSEAISNYLGEISRVLKPNGIVLITWYVLNDEAKANIKAGVSRLAFKPLSDFSMTINPRRPHDDIAFSEEWIRKNYLSNALEIIEPIHWGNWAGRTTYLSSQDIIIGRKRHS